MTNGFKDRAIDLLPRLSLCFLAEDRAAAQRLAVSYPHLYFLLPDGVCYHGQTVSGGKKSGAGPLAMKREARELAAALRTRQGRLDEAEAEYARSENLAGNHARWDFFALLRMRLRNDHDPVSAAAKLKKYLGRETFHIKFNQELAENFDHRDAALAVLRSALSDPENQDLTHLTVISAWALYFGDVDLAFTAMRRNLIDMNSPIVGALWIFKAGYLSDPRFKEIVRDLKLVDYWRASGNWGDFCHPVGTDDFECR